VDSQKVSARRPGPSRWQFAHTGLQFGGVDHSGTGSARGFRAFSHGRAVLPGEWRLPTLFFPPCSARKRKRLDAPPGWTGRS